MRRSQKLDQAPGKSALLKMLVPDYQTIIEDVKS